MKLMKQNVIHMSTIYYKSLLIVVMETDCNLSFHDPELLNFIFSSSYADNAINRQSAKLRSNVCSTLINLIIINF